MERDWDRETETEEESVKKAAQLRYQSDFNALKWFISDDINVILMHVRNVIVFFFFFMLLYQNDYPIFWFEDLIN